MITMKNVTFGYSKKTQPVLKNLNLTLASGRRVWLNGPSGCGKTTLLRLLMGLEKPQKGILKGIEEKTVSVVFQEDRLLPGLTACQNVALFSSETIARKLLAELGLSEAADALPAELSGGMKRRVAIARALAHPSDILILDEPMNGLDEETARQTAAVIHTHLNGRMLVLVTHNPAEAELLHAESVEMASIQE